jgi:hypothetical protein
MSGQSAYLPHGEVEPYPDMDEGEKIVANWISERIRWD